MTWRRRVELRVEVGLRGVAAGNAVWDVSQWDTGAKWSGLEPDFVPIAGSEIESLSVSRGRDKAYNRMPAGTAELHLVWRDVGDRWSMRATSPIQLGQELRVLARVLGPYSAGKLGPPETDFFPIYRGAVRSIVDTWNASNGEFRLTCRLVDRMADLGSVDLPEQTLVGLGDTTDQRLLRIMALAGIDSHFALLDPATVEHQSSNFARNLLDEAQLTVESDAGSTLYVDREGQLRLLRSKAWLDGSGYARGETTQMSWSNSAGVEPVGPTDFGTGQDLDDVRNSISASRSGSTATTVEDSDSILHFGKRTNQRFDLTCRYDADALAWAQLWIDELASKTERVDAVSGEIDPEADTARIADLVDIELLDRQEIHWTDGAGELAGRFHVQGIKHSITARSWRVTVNLWAYAGLGFTPVAPSAWGTAHWGTSVWSAG